MYLDRELEVALDIARQAGELAMNYFAQEIRSETKEDRSPVTVADRECEKLMSRLLADNFPDDGILGEEGAFQASRSGRRWLIDPIDGTRDFVRRTPFWAILIALEAKGEVVLGIVYLPCIKDMLHASIGNGCFYNDGRTMVSEVDLVEKAILTVSGFKAVWETWAPEPVRLLTERCWTVRGYSGSYDIVMLARGKVDIWLSGNGMEWDYAPARIIARECGARFFTRDGTDRIDANNCLICTPGLEPELRRILKVPSTA